MQGKAILKMKNDQDEALKMLLDNLNKKVNEKSKEKPRKENIELKEMGDDDFYIPAKLNTSTEGMNWWQRRKHGKQLKKAPDKTVLIRMEMSNGMFREFLIEEDLGFFYFRKNQYVLDFPMRYFIIERNIWAYDFQEYISIPHKKKIVMSEDVEKLLKKLELAFKKPKDARMEINEVKSLIENSKLIDMEDSLNPTTLKRFTDSEVIKQVLQGAALGKIFKIMFILTIIIGFLLLLTLLIVSYDAGLFEKIGGMFKKG